MDGGYGHHHYGYNGGQEHPRPSSSSYGMVNDMRNTGQAPQPMQPQPMQPQPMEPQQSFYRVPPQYGMMYQPPPTLSQPAFQPQMLPEPTLHAGGHYGDLPYFYNQNNGYGSGNGPQPVFHPLHPPPFYAAPQHPISTEGRDIAREMRYQLTRARQVNYQDYMAELHKKQTAECLVCLEEPSQFAHTCTKCRRKICVDCIKDWFLGACKDESRMPPKCCNEIPLASVLPYMSNAEAELYKAKYEEWRTPDKIYCPKLACSAFIPSRLYTTAEPAFIYPNNFAPLFTPNKGVLQPRVSCPNCATSICTKCRLKSHIGDCSESDLDPDLEARLKRWNVKRCPMCRAGVRKIAGCPHITCRCGGEWCFSCLKRFDLCGGSCEYTVTNMTANGIPRPLRTRTARTEGIEAENDDLDANMYNAHERNCGHNFHPWHHPDYALRDNFPRLECDFCSRAGLLQADWEREPDNNGAWTCARCNAIVCGQCRRRWLAMFQAPAP